MTIDGANRAGDVTTDGLPARRLHPVSPFIGMIFQLRQFVLPLGVGFLVGRDSEAGIPDVVFLAIPLVFALLQFLEWGRFTYEVKDGSLVVDRGLLNRRHREIPLDRVHHIEEIAKLQHRLFGVVKLQVDSGGGESGAEIALDALSRAEAARLRAFIEGRPDAPGPIIRSGGVGAPPLVTANVGSLVVAGVTNVPLAATLALVGSTGQLIDEVSEEFLVGVADRVPATLTGPAGIIFLAAVLYVLFAGGASVLTNFGYVLELDGTELRMQRGLLDRSRSIVDLGKLTVLRIDETIIRRALRLCSIRLQTISGGTEKSGVTGLSVPILRNDEVGRVVASLMPVASPMPDLDRHPAAARRRLYVRWTALSLVVAVPLAWFWRPWGLIVGGLLVLLASLRAEVGYQSLGHATRDGVLVSREGGLRRETAITTWQRTESTRLRSSPLQRWAGLATLFVDVPQGRSVAVADADPALLAELRKLALTGPATP